MCNGDTITRDLPESMANKVAFTTEAYQESIVEDLRDWGLIEETDESIGLQEFLWTVDLNKFLV